MPFSAEVKAEALVKAARHCVVCHRYKGVALELHHIVAESLGGANTIDNAAVLCFDCHCFAGHYNPTHPRGTKYSPQEVKRAKTAWETLVASGQIHRPLFDNPGINTRYLVCTDPGAALDMLSINNQRLPFSVTYVNRGQVFEFFEQIANLILAVPAGPSELETVATAPSRYELYEDFALANSRFNVISGRPISPADLANGLISSPILSFLHKNSVDISELGLVQPCYDLGGCASARGWAFEVLIRPVSFLFAQITNHGLDSVNMQPRINVSDGLSIRPLDEAMPSRIVRSGATGRRSTPPRYSTAAAVAVARPRAP